MILVFVLLLTTTVYGAERLPTVNSDNNAWGAILNNFLSVSLNGSGFLNSNIINAIQINSSVVNTTHIVDGTIIDADISDTTNLTLGEIITFTLGESIDNIVNNW
ncbi:hypothetical protein HYV79_02695, partial [Candidatus Woesearchaeota archaeon]|nr:hypothetical protein [Candidatus Woesearchaeota archaeon]